MRLRLFLLIVVLASGTLAAAPVSAAPSSPVPAAPQAAPASGPCTQGVLPGGALSLICVPSAGWNGGLVVFAHGYVAFNQPLGFYNLTLPDGTYLPDLVQSLGLAFATTSYRRNGLAILEGVQDIRELVAQFVAQHGQPAATYITGASEGGAVTALSAERSADLFDAGLALCGPIGSFRKQVDYWMDFRVLYDYFFPKVLPPSPIAIPAEVIQNWETKYQPQVLSKLAANPLATAQLLSTSKAAFDPFDSSSVGTTTAGILWYNVFATNDGVQQLGGNPYDNSTRVYTGSLNDAKLNSKVQRFKADPQALQALMPYETSGNPGIPLVTMHTTGDPIVPYWHETLYQQKLSANGNTLVTQIPILRYGHCSFTTAEVLVGFSLMVLKGTGQQMYVPAQYDISSLQTQMEGAAIK